MDCIYSLVHKAKLLKGDTLGLTDMWIMFGIYK